MVAQVNTKDVTEEDIVAEITGGKKEKQYTN